MKRLEPTTFALFLLLFVLSLQSAFAQTITKQDNLRFIPGPACYCNPVCITTQPVSPTAVCIGTPSVSFTVCVQGTAPFTYQWRENGIPLSNAGMYSGANTATLSITNPAVALSGKIYRCIITNCNGNNSAITNNNVILTVYAAPTDINKDGITDSADYSLLLQQLNTTCTNCAEDINLDGMVDIYDFLELLGDYDRVCM